MVRADLREPRIKRRNHKPAHAGRFSGPVRGDPSQQEQAPKVQVLQKAPLRHIRSPTSLRSILRRKLWYSSTEGWDVTRLASGVKKIIFGDEFDIQESVPGQFAQLDLF